MGLFSRRRTGALCVAVALGGAACLPRATRVDVMEPDAGADVLAEETRDAGPDSPANDAEMDSGMDSGDGDVGDVSIDVSHDVVEEPYVRVSTCAVPPAAGVSAGTVRAMAEVHAALGAQPARSLFLKSALRGEAQSYYALGGMNSCAPCTAGSPPACAADPMRRFDLAVVAVRADGDPTTPAFDESFSNGIYSQPGAACIDVDHEEHFAFSGRFDAAGRLVVGGNGAEADRFYGTLFRLQGAAGAGAVPGAALDTTFGDRGGVDLRPLLPPGLSTVFSVWPLPDGGVIAVGANQNEFNPATLGFVVRLDANGRAVPTFGPSSSPGAVVVDLALGLYASHLDTTGPSPRLVALGRSIAPNRFRLVRYDVATGAVDTSFGPRGTGVVDVDVGALPNPRALLFADGAYYAFGARGAVADGDSTAVVARVSRDGIVDATFAGAGLLRLDLRWNHGFQFENTVVAGCDGWVYASGLLGDGTVVGVQRFDARGRLDLSYGSSGIVRLTSGVEVPTSGTRVQVSPVALFADPRDATLTVALGSNENSGPYTLRLNP